MSIQIKELMTQSGVAFGTSGARGLAVQMSDRLCYAYTRGFLQYLESIDELSRYGTEIAIAGDLRPSTGRIMKAVAKAAADMGYTPINCGRSPSPAVALYGLQHQVPAIMVTGSHIPDDRNGIKFNKASGEVLKTDEAGIVSQRVELPDALFEPDQSFSEAFSFPEVDPQASEAYVARYLDVFPSDCLKGTKIGFYQHSAVGRDLIPRIFEGLGAEVIRLGFSETFVPVDTEAIRPEDVVLARSWSAEHGFDAILSTDGDSDRPLISDEKGEWLRGDIAGILAARYLGADSVSTPVSCNTALEKSGIAADVRRTRIGSPFVVASMMEATAEGQHGVVGYEANGGFLTNSCFSIAGGELPPLPTRDAVLPALCILLLSIRERLPISALVAALPPRYTLSDRLQDFPTEDSRDILERLGNFEAIDHIFHDAFGPVTKVDRTDGVRMTFSDEGILHLRPSGNAPEFRCYAEAGTSESVAKMLEAGMAILRTLRT